MADRTGSQTIAARTLRRNRATSVDPFCLEKLSKVRPVFFCWGFERHQIRPETLAAVDVIECNGGRARALRRSSSGGKRGPPLYLQGLDRPDVFFEGPIALIDVDRLIRRGRNPQPRD